MRIEPNPHKGMTPPSTQNLKELGLWVFFLICCSTFSFLLNVGLRLTLGYLTRSCSVGTLKYIDEDYQVVRLEEGSYGHVQGLKYELIEIGHMD